MKFLLALVAFTALASVLLLGPAGFRPEPQSAEAANLSEIKKLLASDADGGDNFGISVAVSGDFAVVGAYREGAGGNQAGAAYVFQRNEGGADNWGEVKKLTASDAESPDGFGIFVALSGETAVVGAYREEAGGYAAGAAYVFQRDQGGMNNWGEVKKLTASDAQALDYFGRVAVSGDIVVVGAWSEDAGGNNAGAAYVFQRDQGGMNNWGEVKKLTASDAQAGDYFGIRVAVSGETIVVGAQFGSANGDKVGAAYVFQRDYGGTSNWGELKKLTASDAQASDLFGQSVAVSGDTAVVGALREDTGGSNAGAAYVYQRDQGGMNNWGEVKKLTASDAQDLDEFGVGVAVNGDTIVVGAWHEDAGGGQAGAAYVFRQDLGGAGNWGEVTKLMASDAQASDRFGRSVAVSGDTAFAGAENEGTGVCCTLFSRGAAYLFDLLQPKTTPADTPTPGGSPTVTPTPTTTPVSQFEETLASKYAPVLYQVNGAPCDPTADPYEPEDVEIILNNPAVELKREQFPLPDQLITTAPTAKDLYFVDETYYLNLPGNPWIPSCDFETDYNALKGSYAPAAYAHFVQAEDGSNHLVLQYWFFYYFNDYNNTHEGDWEMIQLEFGVSTAEEALLGEPRRISYSQHGSGHRLPWNDPMVEKQNDKPVVYVAKGSHANYFMPGTYFGEPPDALGCDRTSREREVLTAAFLLPDSVVGSQSPVAWIEFPGHWGQVNPSPYDSPRGPVFQGSRWTAPIAWQNSLRDYSTPAEDCWLPTSTARHLGQGAIERIENFFAVPLNQLRTRFRSVWPGSEVSMTLESPSGVTIDPSTTDPAVTHQKGPDFEYYDIDDPEPGAWTVILEGTDLPPGGEDVTVTASFVPQAAADADQDSIPDATDNCVSAYNPAQADFDGDTAGDACDPDDDDDGCTDSREFGPDETVGGLRDPLNPWDFYDVETISGPGQDGVVDLAFDILSVIQHYAPTGAAPYDAQYDRGPSAGPNAWNMTAPDGVIDLANDILGVIQQYDHRCT